MVVASGPSAAVADLECARDRARVFCVNESWRLAPWAFLLYGCDGAWWKKRGGVPEFGGLKVTHDLVACVQIPGLRQIHIERRRDEILDEHFGVVGDGGNSGFQLLNLVAQRRPAKIIMVGFDMRLDHGVHWHGRHVPGLANPHQRNVDRWRRVIDNVAGSFRAMGIAVVNASEVSALTAYPKMPLAEALA